MMVVVPALAEGKQCDYPVVSGRVTRSKTTRTPQVGGRVDQPGGVQANHGAEENAPEQEGQSADRQQRQAQDNHGDIVVLRDPDVKPVPGEVGDVVGEGGGVMMHGLASENPAHVRPPLAVPRRMW